MKSATVALSLLVASCNAARSRTIAWEPIVACTTRAAVERVRAGRVDPADAALAAVCVDQAGDVTLMHFADGKPRAEVLYRNGGELTGIAIGDVDPSVTGNELYVGGCAQGDPRKDANGAVFQIAMAGSPARASVRCVYTATAYVHSIELVEPQHERDTPHLLIGTNRGEMHLLTPAAAAWSDVTLHREPSGDVEAVKVKDSALLASGSGTPRHEALIAFKGGRVLLLDLQRPDAARTVHEEPGGVSRVTADANGGAYVTGYAGRLLHFVRDGERFRVDVLDQEGADSGLRGCVLGDFPTEAGVAHLALFGYHKLCRALVERHGVLDPVTLCVDVDRGHTIEAADLVPGNGASELLFGGYSNRVTLLVAR